jgi:hypothetical protein
MEQGWFDKPVVVSVGVFGTVHYVSNAREAADLLLNHWPAPGSRTHRVARQSCLEVLRGLKDARVAREDFMQAARDADILME